MREPFEQSMASAMAELKMARESLNQAIQDYPTPVAGCDVQYNHLLAERRKVLKALRALDSDVFIPTPRTLYPGTGVESR